MKLYKYKKWKIIIQINILIFSYFICYARFNIIQHNLNNEYIRIEKYLNKCNSFNDKEQKKYLFSSSPKISIITPVYNSEKYIIRLLKSIEYQKFLNLEILLIDDFSNDKTIELIKKYQIVDQRIKLIENKKNKGTFICRNVGIMKSRGYYIFLPDSDDILLENSLNYFYNFALKYDYDFVRFNAYITYGKSFFEKITNQLKQREILQPELSTYIFYGTGFLLQVDYNIWNKIIKREPLIKALNSIDNIYLNLYMTCHEDGLLNYILYRTAKSSYFSKKFGYYYIRNNYKNRKSYYNFNNMKFSFIHIMNVFNYSKNNKYEKDMTNEIFKRLIKSKKIRKRLYLFTKEFNFFINAIDILNENEFFLNKYKKYLNDFKKYFLKVMNKK